MSSYLVTMCSELPYRVEKSYTVKATNLGVALRRGFAMYRREITELKRKALHIKSVKASATKL